MYYQLSYKINDDRLSNQELANMIAQLDYMYVQQLNWTSGHFIIESFENRLLTTLIAFPHYKKPDRELILVQEYILDRIGINFEDIVLYKWISSSKDDIDNEYNILPNNLVIRQYHQDYFFEKILQISINEKSPGIPAEFYANYYFIGNIIFDKNNHNTTFKDIENDIGKLRIRFDNAYKSRKNEGLPIFIVNEQNKLEFELLRSLIINQIKTDYPPELKFSIQTRIENDLLLYEIEYINTVQFSNNLIGQIWDITINTSQLISGSFHTMLKNNLIPIVVSNRLHTLIIIRNSKLLAINDWLQIDSYIIV